MEKFYSTIFIVDISQNPDEVETVASRIQQLIEDHGGIIKKTNRWGKRRLAYPIDKKTHGFYVEIEYNANSRLNIPKILENEFRLNDRVLRYMTYIVDKKELVQRAKNAGKMKTEETRGREPGIENSGTIDDQVKMEPDVEVAAEQAEPGVVPVEQVSEENKKEEKEEKEEKE